MQIMGRRALGAQFPSQAATCQRLLEASVLEHAGDGEIVSTVGPLEILLCVDDPGRAVGIATGVVGQIHSNEVPLCCAVHTGDVQIHPSPLTGRNEVAGPSVWIARELAALAEAGQVLITDAAAGLQDPEVTQHTRREDLGERALCGRPTRCWLVEDPTWRAPVVPETPTSLPIEVRPRPEFVGRDEEREGIVATLTSDRRALALVGPVGVGKSALMTACVEDLVPAHFDHVIEVHALEDTDVPSVLERLERAAMLGPKPRSSPRERAGRVAAKLDGARTLVVIHDADPLRQAPEVVPSLLRGRGIGALLSATAPIPEVHSAPVALPDHDDAVELFLLRLQAVDDKIKTPPDSELVALVDRLGRSPFAVEVAASHVTEVGLDAVMKWQELGLDLPNALFNVPRRPQTARVAVGRQWRALPAALQRAVLLLAVFLDDFGKKAVQAACDGDEGLMVGLGDHGLIVRSGAKWRLHAPIRAFALEQLRGSPELSVAVQMYVRQVASDPAATLRAAEVVGAFNLLPPGDEELALSLVSVAGPQLVAIEEEMVFLHLLERLEARDIQQGTTLRRLVAAWRLVPDRLAARKSAEQLYTALSVPGSPVVTAHLHLALARVHGARGEFAEARASLTALRRNTTHPTLLAQADLASGRLCLLQGDWAAAQKDLFAAFSAATGNNGLHLVEVQRLLARAMVGQGQLDVAAMQLHGASTRATSLNHAHARIKPALDTAILLLARNDGRAAGPQLRTCTHLARVAQSAREEARVLAWSALAALANGKVGEASRRMGAAQSCARVSPSEVQKLVHVANAVLCAVNRHVMGAMDSMAKAREPGGFVSPAVAGCLVELVRGIGDLMGARSEIVQDEFGASSGGNGLEARAAAALVQRIGKQLTHSSPRR